MAVKNVFLLGWNEQHQGKLEAGAVATSVCYHEPSVTLGLYRKWHKLWASNRRGTLREGTRLEECSCDSWARKNKAHSGQAAVGWHNSHSTGRLSCKRGPGSLGKDLWGDSGPENLRPSTPRSSGCCSGLGLASGESRLPSETFLKENVLSLGYRDMSFENL